MDKPTSKKPLLQQFEAPSKGDNRDKGSFHRGVEEETNGGYISSLVCFLGFGLN